MKAFVKVRPEPRGVQYVDLDDPHAGAEDVVVQVMAAGICGSDVHIYDWAENKVQDSKIRLPVVMGHEVAGTIVEVGSCVRGFEQGDRVTINPVLNCGTCYFCKKGQENICDDRSTLGYRINGAFAQFIKVDSAKAFKLEDMVSFEIGALSELTCVGLHAIDRIQVSRKDKVAIIGCGPLGLVLMILLKHFGNEQIFMTGLMKDHERLQLSGSIGAIPIQTEYADPKEQLLELTNGLGVDVVFESAGSPSAVKQSLNIVRKSGKIGILGQGLQPTEIPTAMISFREVKLIGSRAHTTVEWQKVSRILLEVDEDMKRIITHTLPLSKAEDGINMIKKRIGMKIILLPQQKEWNEVQLRNIHREHLNLSML